MSKIEELDPVAYRIIQSIPTNEILQAQYSTQDQIKVLMEVALKLKLYDALDLLRRTFLK